MMKTKSEPFPTSTSTSLSPTCSYALLIFLLLLRYCSILPGNNVLLDCDEVYNYWEPLLFTVKDDVTALNGATSFQVSDG